MKTTDSSPPKRLAISKASLMTMPGVNNASSSISKTAIRRMFRSTTPIRSIRQFFEA